MGFFVAIIALLLAGCTSRGADAPAHPADAITLVDDAGRQIDLPAPARRIVSLVPAATETITALGAVDRLVGRTTYDHDTTVAHLPIVGGGLDPNIETIVGLRPDLVISWSSQERSTVRAKLAEVGIPSLALELQDTSDVYRGIALIGRALGRSPTADSLMAAIRASIRATHARARQMPSRRIFYVVYNDPPMTAGPHTFIGQLIEIVGGTNIFADAGINWPTVEIEELVRRAPDVVVLPKGEMPANTLDRLRAEPGWRELSAIRRGCIVQVDVDLANRPGPNLARAAATLFELVHTTCPATR